MENQLYLKLLKKKVSVLSNNALTGAGSTPELLLQLVIKDQKSSQNII